jgi:hypothetical protein
MSGAVVGLSSFIIYSSNTRENVIFNKSKQPYIETMDPMEPKILKVSQPTTAHIVVYNNATQNRAKSLIVGTQKCILLKFQLKKQKYVAVITIYANR